MLVTMTDKELYRLGIIQRVFDRALLQRDAADIIELSVRVWYGCIVLMAQPRLHLPAVAVLQITGSMKRSAVKPWI